MCVGRDIPFMVEVDIGNMATILIQFVHTSATLKYEYKCVTPKGELFCFRTASDARFTAKGNDWRYVGK